MGGMEVLPRGHPASPPHFLIVNLLPPIEHGPVIFRERPMSVTIDLNADMGESFGAYTIGDDAAMLEIVTTANVAGGFHGGDAQVMHRTVALAKARGIAIGAHPSFLDLWGFGRRQIIGDTPEEIGRFVLYQVGALQA